MILSVIIIFINKKLLSELITISMYIHRQKLKTTYIQLLNTNYILIITNDNVRNILFNT